MRTAAVFSRSNNRTIDFCLAEDLATLVWLANLADLELHTSLARADDVTAADLLAFDLDPGRRPPSSSAPTSRSLRAALDHLGLAAFPKTSGSKGMQVYVPLHPPADYERTSAFARALAQVLERRRPEQVVSAMSREKRTGRVFVDWSQNSRHKTTICVYSLRARARPTVSTPLRWEEVEAVAASRDPDELVFDSAAVLARVETHGDLFAPVLELRQGLPAAAA